MVSSIIKSKAVRLRLEGKSLNHIARELKVAKSTLSGWCKHLPKPNHIYYTNRSEWLIQIRKLSALSIKTKRLGEVEKIANAAKTDVESWTNLNDLQTQKAILSTLYWAEGQKLPLRGAPVKFTNTDPRLVLLFITLLRKCYVLDEKKFRIQIHIHWYHNKTEVISFWSKLLGVPISQFTKTYHKKRSNTKKFRKNFAGICFVIYQNVDLRWEIVETAYNIQKLITGHNQLLANYERP